MSLDLFAVAAPGQARCRRPDARGLRDLAQLGMRVAMKLGGTGAEARAEQEAFGGPVVHVTDPLVTLFNQIEAGQPSVHMIDAALVTRLVRELISHGAGRRPAVIYCEDGAVRTGLVCGALRLALGHPLEEVVEEYTALCDLARLSIGMIPWTGSPEAASDLSPGRFHDLAVDYLRAVAGARG